MSRTTQSLVAALEGKVEHVRAQLKQLENKSYSEPEIDPGKIDQASFNGLSHHSPVPQLTRALDFVASQIQQLKQACAQGQDNYGNISLHKAEQISDNLIKVWRAISLKNKQVVPRKRATANFNKNYSIDWDDPVGEMDKLKQYESRLQQQLTLLIDQGAASYKIDYARERLQRCRDTYNQIQMTQKK